MDFVVVEQPDWRRTKLSTSEMLVGVVDFCSRYEKLSQEEKIWARTDHAKVALGEYLFQVNKIEKEGFDTYGETVEAIEKGALDLAEKQDDPRLESLRSLHRALKHFWIEDEQPQPELSIQELEKCHAELLASTNAEIAGRIRGLEKEVVFTKTEDDGVHVFTWPTLVRDALDELFAKTKSAISEISRLEPGSKARIEAVLKLGGSFFLEFENIHPFLDGNGRCGRILLAALLRSVMPFPNVFFVDRDGDYGLPPYITPAFYYECFHEAQSQQAIELDGDGRPIVTMETAKCKLEPPRHLTALIIEGVYVGWKRFFKRLGDSDGDNFDAKRRKLV